MKNQSKELDGIFIQMYCEQHNTKTVSNTITHEK